MKYKYKFNRTKLLDKFKDIVFIESNKFVLYKTRLNTTSLMMYVRLKAFQ